MSKTLFLFRHAKSSWDYPELSDYERPLNKRGFRSIEVMSQRLINRKIIFDKVYSSPALRAAYTARSIAQNLGFNLNEIIYTERLYDSSVRDIRDVLFQNEAEINSIAIFSHNPTLTSFAGNYLKNFYENIPTLGLLEIEFSCENWSDINENNSKLILFDYPKKVSHD